MDASGRRTFSLDYGQLARLAGGKVLSLLRPDLERSALAALDDVPALRRWFIRATHVPGISRIVAHQVLRRIGSGAASGVRGSRFLARPFKGPVDGGTANREQLGDLMHRVFASGMQLNQMRFLPG